MQKSSQMSKLFFTRFCAGILSATPKFVFMCNEEVEHSPARLHAPWRMEYITNADGPKDGCVFCTKPTQENDRENGILYRGSRAYIILNAYPYNSGHLMVIPYLHTAEFTALDAETLAEMMALAQLAQAALTQVMHPQGYNLGMNLGQSAGAGIAEHLHLHVVPRWTGDTNFMPVLGNTRVLPESLERTWERVKVAIDELTGEK